MSTTINELAKLLKSDDKKGDTSFWGVVQSTITDGQGNVTGYNVSLDSGGQTGVVKCNKVVGAKQGDQVLVTLRANGEAVVVATKGGDTDVQDVADDLATNYSTTEEVEEMIEEHGGGSYQIVEWARSSSSSSAPSSGWSTTMPTLTTSYPYLWQRIVTVTGETRTTGTPQRAETMDGLYVFMNTVSADAGHTTISGGKINISNAIYSGDHNALDSTRAGAYLGIDGISFTDVDDGTMTSIRRASSGNCVQIKYWDSDWQVWRNKFYVSDDGDVYAAGNISTTGGASFNGDVEGDAFKDVYGNYCMTNAIGSGRIMDWGTVNITVSGTSVATADITFNHTFSSAPYVFCTANPSTTMRVGASAAYVTTTGCKICAFGNVSGVSGSTPVRWLAIGY